ncbi:hypothetical protein CW311_04295 [Acinetobacter proteolyticus]|uniref:Lipoprotein n=1 Tax=Acinetobacter proteolyticus TaxID=1776741 RepID=A0A2N0WIC5_9GAMM|nr:hypothetical protein CW311_04295 [Acinetobacter proteolyticus]
MKSTSLKLSLLCFAILVSFGCESRQCLAYVNTSKTLFTQVDVGSVNGFPQYISIPNLVTEKTCVNYSIKNMEFNK